MTHAALSQDRAREKPCASCGKVFTKDPRCTHSYFARQKYCSQACAANEWSRLSAERRPTIREAFASKYEVDENGCHIWTGILGWDGYGILAYGKKNYRANRLALELAGHVLPPGSFACHTCDNPRCVNPEHLYVGTPQSNMRDAKARGRVRRGETSASAKLTAEAVIEIRQSSLTHEKLAEKFNVSRAAVSLASSRRTWRHLP